MNNKINKSEFSRFDRRIREAEMQELNRMNFQEDTLEQYFTEKRKKELSRKNLKDMDFQEIHELDELRKSSFDINIRKNVVENEYQEPEDIQSEIMQTLDACELAASKNRPELVNDFRKLKALLEKSNLGHTPRASAADTEEISDEEPVEVSKGLSIMKSSGKTLVSGWSTVEEIDYGGDILPSEKFAEILQKFYQTDGKICLQHDSSNIIGKLRSFEVKKTKEGKQGIYVIAELTNPDIEKMIESRALTGFSWSFNANRHKTCEKNRCFNNLEPFTVNELSIVDHPCNPSAKIEQIHHSS